MADEEGRFIYKDALKSRLDHLILAIEIASLVYLGHAKGHAAAKLIWRKESRLRKTTATLELKQREILEREEHLMSVGGVTLEQLAMEPVHIHDGVYAFVDMVGSVGISRNLVPRDYVFLLNLCHEIAGETARTFGCRVDNFIGDAVFFQSLSIFDKPEESATGPGGRLMRMTCLLASVMGQIRSLAIGNHPLDREKRVSGFFKANKGLTLGFRAGMSHGSALVGPLGSKKRKIITAIGETIDLASRLESSGIIHHIHLTQATAEILKDSWVSNETPLVFDFANKVLSRHPGYEGKPSFSFMEFYRSWLGLGKDVILSHENPSYKEFSHSETCLLPCLPEDKPVTFCSGI